jgi:glycosyltransferase involved in cell wall biosynthesis
MRIAQLAPLVESVPPHGYGGIELVVSLLTEGLVKRGHDVTLFAAGGSRTRAQLVSVVDRPLRNHPHIKPHQWMAYDFQSLIELQAREHEFDILHNHLGWQAIPFLANLSTPTLTTNHNLLEPATTPIYERYGYLPYVGISKSFTAKNGAAFLNYVDTVYNGIDISKYTFDKASDRNYLVFLGRLSRDKGIVESLEIAKRLGLPIKVAGKVDPNDREYFHAHVETLMRDPLVDYIGEIGIAQKNALFKHAIALVYPINFDEPFGLVMVEALACGVPALAIDRGSVREVLSDDTAVIADSVDELVQRFKTVYSISRSACHKRAVNLFSAKRMVEHYERIFDQIITRHQPLRLVRANRQASAS